MEPLGLAVGVVTLAGLFSTCLECFECIDLGCNFSRDAEILMAKLESHKLIFSIWGQAVGLENGGDQFGRRFRDPEIRKGIHRLLTCIHMVFLDAEKLTKKYGIEKVSASDGKSRAVELFTSRPWSVFRSQVRLPGNGASFVSKVRWAIHDKNKFEAMIADLRDLIDQLRDLTASVADLEKQRKIFIEEVSSVSDVTSLELLEDALREDDREASDVASQRILQLTNGSLCETMGLVTSESESTYVTAPSEQSGEVQTVDDLCNKAIEDEPRGAELDDISTAIENSLMLQPPKAKRIVNGHLNSLRMIQDADRETIKALNNYSRGLKSTALVRMIREIEDFFCNIEIWDVSVRVLNESGSLLGTVKGPAGSPYEGGIFSIFIIIPEDYPFAPPICRFRTPIYHPNINRDGIICMSTLDSSWTPAWTIPTLLVSICSLLSEPCFADPLVPHIAKQYFDDPIAFEIQARIHTQRYGHRDPPTEAGPTKAVDYFEGPKFPSELQIQRMRSEGKKNFLTSLSYYTG